MISYNSKRIIPAPFIQYSKVYDTSEDGRKIGSRFQITVTGKILADRGSPKSDGSFWNVSGYPPNETISSQDVVLGMLLRKQEALRTLFADEGKSFEVQSDDGSPALKFNPRIVRPIEFRQGDRTSWAYVCDY